MTTVHQDQQWDSILFSPGHSIVWQSRWVGLLSGLILNVMVSELGLGTEPPAPIPLTPLRQMPLAQPEVEWREFDVIPLQESNVRSTPLGPGPLSLPRSLPPTASEPRPATSNLPAPPPQAAPLDPPFADPISLPSHGQPIQLQLIQPVADPLNPPAEPVLPWLAPPYTLTVGDRLGIIFQNVPEYTAQYQVQIDGSLHLPIVGSLPVWGLTLTEVERRIEQLYAKRDVLRHPAVILNLLVMAPLRIAVTGEVVRPGSYRLPPLDTSVLPTITDAIQQAGGITQYTNLQQIFIDRRHPSGKRQRLSANLWQLLQTGDLDQDLTLRDGDVITLETALPEAVSQTIALGNANIAAKSVRVGIWGEGQQTGTFDVPPNTPLNQVLLAAGGFNPRAQTKTVDLIRLMPNGTVSQRTITIDITASVNETHNPIIFDRDIIRIHTARLYRFSDRLNRIVAPLSNTVDLLLQPVKSVFSIMNVFDVFRSFFGPKSAEK